MLLIAAADSAQMEKVFDSFFRRTLFYMQAWAKTSAEVIIQHDDFVWTRGPFMRPDIYRKVIIPRGCRVAVGKLLRAAGKKVMFCSDGNFMQFAGDIVAAGADGLIFEPCNDFDFMVENFGQTTCLVGSFVDCRDLAAGRWEKVRTDIDRTCDQLTRCKGALVAVNACRPTFPSRWSIATSTICCRGCNGEIDPRQTNRLDNSPITRRVAEMQRNAEKCLKPVHFWICLCASLPLCDSASRTLFSNRLIESEPRAAMVHSRLTRPHSPICAGTSRST